MIRRLPLLPTLLVLALLVASVLLLGVAFGDVHLAPTALLRAAAHRLLPSAVADADTYVSQIFDLRLPRVLVAALVGACLAVSGAVLQGVTRNPLADPYTAGVSSGAAVGASLATVFGWAALWHGAGGSLLAFGAAMATLLLVFALSRVGGRVSTAGFLLSGVVVGSFLWSVTTLILYRARQDQTAIFGFLLGRFGDATMAQVALLAPLTLLAVAGFAAAGRGLDAFAFGEEVARGAGIETERFKTGALLGAAFLTAATVSVAGIIGFVGLIAPHAARALVGPVHRGAVPASALLGATLCVLADLLARAVPTGGAELPVGVVIALLGTPFFAVLLRRASGV